MALVFTNVLDDASSTVDQNSYAAPNTASLTAGRGYLITVVNDCASTANTPTLTNDGTAEVWTAIPSASVEETGSHRRTTIFWGVATVTQVVTFTHDYAGQTQEAAALICDEVTGFDPASPYGSVGTGTGTSTNPNATLSATLLGDARNVVYGGVHCAVSNLNIAPTAGWSELGESLGTGTQIRIASLMRQGSRSVSWATTSTAYAAVAVEIRADPSSYAVGVRSVYNASSTTDATTYAWNTVPVIEDKFYLMSVTNWRASGTSNVSTATSSGGETISLVSVGGNDATEVGGGAVRVTTLWFRALATGNINITSAFAAQSQLRAGIVVTEFTGEDPNPIVQCKAATAGTANATVALGAALADPDNINYSGLAIGTSVAAKGTGWYELGNTGVIEGNVLLADEFIENTQTALWASGAATYAITSVEIKARVQSPQVIVAPSQAAHRASSW